jgi:hypothetical protein
VALLFFATPASATPHAPADDRLAVSANHHFLVHADGRPFFYLADTAWELFHRLNREEADRYLADRAAKGFTVIQAVALAELDGLRDPNAYGHLPLVDNDPTRPRVIAGPRNDYWDQVDYIVDQAASLGLRIAFLPAWGDKWFLAAWGRGPVIFTPENARAYGEWLGRRYRDRPNIIWVLGGDRAPKNKTHLAIIRAMAEGLRAGDGGTHLITFHPPGHKGSAQWFHDDTWLDFNLRQNGHGVTYEAYAQTLADYQRLPAKPVIDGEPVYEDHPVAFKASEQGHTIAADVRRALYWDLFNGACGHTYGHHSIWQMYRPGRQPVNHPLMSWDEALSAIGSTQMQYGRWLLESRPFLTRIPDPTLLVEGKPATAWPGAGVYRFVATRDESGSYAMVYAPVGRKFAVRTGVLAGKILRSWWYDPRTGHAQLAGEFTRTDTHEFISPSPGEHLDWVLVLDDVAKNYPAPGTRD